MRKAHECACILDEVWFCSTKMYNSRFVDRYIWSFRKRFLCSWPCDPLKRGSTSFLPSARFLSECQKHSRKLLVIDGDQYHASAKYLRFPFRLISSVDSWKDSLLPPRLLISRIASALLRFLQFADPSAEAYAKFLLIVFFFRFSWLLRFCCLFSNNVEKPRDSADPNFTPDSAWHPVDSAESHSFYSFGFETFASTSGE